MILPSHATRACLAFASVPWNTQKYYACSAGYTLCNYHYEEAIIYFFCEAQCCTSAPIYWTVLNIKLCKIEMDNGKFVFRNLLAKWNVKKHCLFCSLINLLAMKYRTRQTDEWTVILVRQTLKSLAWASGRVLVSNPECIYLSGNWKQLLGSLSHWQRWGYCLLLQQHMWKKLWGFSKCRHWMLLCLVASQVN